MAINKGYQQLIDEAQAKIHTRSLNEAKALHDNPKIVFVDIREIRELERDGMIPGALHAPRGMLEFWVDPLSPYHKEIFSADKEFILYCASAWRSALAAATLQEMGMEAVSHMEGGFKAWEKAGLPIIEKPKRC